MDGVARQLEAHLRGVVEQVDGHVVQQVGGPVGAARQAGGRRGSGADLLQAHPDTQEGTHGVGEVSRALPYLPEVRASDSPS